MKAPCIRPDAENCSVRNLPKRDELLFLRGAGGGVRRAAQAARPRPGGRVAGRAHQTVLAQPKLSMIGLVCSTRMCRSVPAALTSARYCRRILAVSVFPAPDSPEMMTDCGREGG